MDCNTTVIDKIDLKPWVDQEPKLRLPITKKTLEKALKLGLDQYRRLEAAESKSINQANAAQPREINSAVSAHAALMAPKRESLDLARTAAILRETTKVLLRGLFHNLIFFCETFFLEKVWIKVNGFLLNLIFQPFNVYFLKLKLVKSLEIIQLFLDHMQIIVNVFLNLFHVIIQQNIEQCQDGVIILNFHIMEMHLHHFVAFSTLHMMMVCY